MTFHATQYTQGACRGCRGQKGSTSVWGPLASELSRQVVSVGRKSEQQAQFLSVLPPLCLQGLGHEGRCR